MNLSFDLQLFVPAATAASYVEVKDGITFDGSNTYTISNIQLSKAFTSDSAIANLEKVSISTLKSALAGGLTDAASADSLVTFGGADDENTLKAATLRGSGSYTWEINTDTLEDVYLGSKAKLNLLKTKENKINVTLDSAAGQSITFGGSNSKVALEVVEDELAGTQTSLDGSVAIKGGKGDFSLLSGSSLTGASMTGAAGEVVTLSTDNTNEAIFNLKGTDAEAIVTVQGSVSSSEVTGFNSIVFDAKKTTAAQVSLASVRNSTVSILGGTGKDSVTIGANNVNSGSSIIIEGGQEDDVIQLSGTGYETIVLAKDHAKDSITGWKESTGDTTKGNTVSLSGSIDNFGIHTVDGGYADVSVGGDGSAQGATLFSSSTYKQLGVNLITKEDTYSALLVGSAGLDSAAGTKFDNFNYIIADSSKTLDLNTAKKSVVVLANEVDTKHWGDNNVYQNITTVKSSTAGKSLIINGKETETSIYAAGSNDSIWGGANGVADTYGTSTSKTNISIFTGKDDGLDVLSNYTFGTTKDKANVVRFLDGVEYIAAGNKSLTFGANDSNALAVTFDNTGDNKIAYAFGSDGEKYIAGVDASSNGGSIAYDSLASVYIGQGDNSKIVASSGDEVKLGWDGGAGYVNVGVIDATLAKEGSVVVGTTEYGQSIAGSYRGASSISGGFVADKWTDENADTLVGGGVATKSTTFFVGKDMGRDEIIDLSSKDNIVFLGTKYADLVSDLAPDASDNSLTFKFAGNTIEASLQTGKTMKSLTDVSLYFDDGTYVWNGTEFAKAE